MLLVALLDALLLVEVTDEELLEVVFEGAVVLAEEVLFVDTVLLDFVVLFVAAAAREVKKNNSRRTLIVLQF